MNPSLDTTVNDKIQAFINAPFGLLRVDDLRIGRVIFRKVEVAGREAANSLYNLLELACLRTQRNRLRKDGSRFLDVITPGTPGRLLSEEARDYVSDMRRRKLKPNSVEKTERTLAILKMATGDIEVSRIDHNHLQRMWELLRWAPSKLASDPALKQQSVDALIEMGMASERKALSDETLALHHRSLSAFFNHLVDADAIRRSPMKGFKLPKASTVKKSRKALRLFTDADLGRIFAPGTYLSWASDGPHRWWCPILTLYTGARISEIAQLHLQDVIRGTDGSLSIQIHAVADEDLEDKEIKSRMTIKGESAIRCIPVAEPLIAAGFSDFLADLERHGHRRLFPHLSAGVNRKTGETNARYSTAVQRDFGSYLKALGFANGVGFHAFRHTLATDLDDQGVSEADVATLTGHALDRKVATLHDNYYHPGERKPQHRKHRQKSALKLYRPDVQVPMYQSGQFDKVLAPGNVFYP